MEQAHEFVDSHVHGEMKRQKRYHDSKLSWMSFDKGNKVYVFFPQRKVGTSSKLTSYWRGPFDITRKFSDFLYEVNCGYRGKTQVIHVDRLRLQKPQLLRGESAVGDTADTHSDYQDL